MGRAGAAGQQGSRPLISQTCLAEAERTAVGPSRKEGCTEVERGGVPAAQGTAHSRWPDRRTGASLASVGGSCLHVHIGFKRKLKANDMAQWKRKDGEKWVKARRGLLHQILVGSHPNLLPTHLFAFLTELSRTETCRLMHLLPGVRLESA